MTLRRAILAISTVTFVAGCSNAAQSPVVPSGTAAQTQPLGRTLPDKKGGRVLYIADIDGQPGVGQIWVYSASMKSPQLIRMITTGAGRPFGLWVDRKNVLYVANEPNKYPASVTEFKPGASSPFFTINHFKGYPGSVAADDAGNVYVNESVQDEGVVQVFPRGSDTAAETIDTGVGGYAFNPGSMAFDTHGNLIVAEQAKLALQIVQITPGTWNVTPLNFDLTNITGPGIGIDKAGNTYVGSGDSAAVYVFAPGQTEPFRSIGGAAAYGLTWVTPQGAVYQASGSYSVAEISPGATSVTNTVSCQCSAQGVAVSR